MRGRVGGRIPAHLEHRLGILAVQDPAPERVPGDVAGPVEDGPQADVVARVEVAVVGGHEGEVGQRQERLRVRLVLVLGDEVLGLPEELLGRVRGVLLGPGEVEVGRRRQELGGLVGAQRA